MFLRRGLIIRPTDLYFAADHRMVIREHRTQRVTIFCLLVLAAGLGTTFSIWPSVYGTIFGPVGQFGLILLTSLSGATLILLVGRSGVASLGFVLFSGTWLFHLGLMSAVYFGLSDSYGFLSGYVDYWIDVAVIRQAFFIATGVMSFFAVGYVASFLVHTWCRGRLSFSGHSYQTMKTRTRSVLSGVQRRDFDVSLSVSSTAAVVIGSSIVLLNYSLLNGYQALLAPTGSSYRWVGPILITVGIVVAVSTQSRAAIALSFLVGLGTLALMAVSGGRQMLLTVALATVVTYSKAYGRRFGPIWLLLAPPLLYAISILRVIRTPDKTLREASPLSGLYELGTSIRALFEWLVLEHESPEDSLSVPTHLAWIMNKIAASGLLESGQSIYGGVVDRLARELGAAYGFATSNIVELYASFPLYVALSGAVLGGCFVYCIDEYRWSTRIGATLVGVVAMPSIYSIRQPASIFFPQLISLLVGLMCVLTVASVASYVLCKVRSRRSDNRLQNVKD